MLAGCIRFAKRFLTYEVWRIYSFDTSRAHAPEGQIRVTRIEDTEAVHVGAPKELLRARCDREGAIGFAAWADGELAGVCWLWPGSMLTERPIGAQPPDCAEIIQITVAERARGRGIAPHLIGTAARCMRELGFRRLYAQIWHSNTASMKAFRKCAWEAVAWVVAVEPRWLPHLRIRRKLQRWQRSTDLLPNW